jgi:hypothetical protein
LEKNVFEWFTYTMFFSASWVILGYFHPSSTRPNCTTKKKLKKPCSESAAKDHREAL